MVGDVVKYDPHSHEVFVTKICLDRGMKPATQTLTSRLESARSSDEVQEIFAVSTLSSLSRVSEPQF